MVDAPHHERHGTLTEKQKGKKMMESNAVGAAMAGQRTKAMVAIMATTRQ